MKSKRTYLNEYRASEFVIFDGETFVEFRVGKKNPALTKFMKTYGAESATLITAWNPRSKKTQPAKNKAANIRLLKDLQKGSSAVFCAQGRATDYSMLEDSYVALDLSWEDGEKLGAKYDQNAIVYVEVGQAPELVWTAKD